MPRNRASHGEIHSGDKPFSASTTAMKILSQVTFLLAIFILAAAVLLGQEERSLIPIENFFRPQKLSRVTLSPDGLYVAGLAPIDKGEEIGLATIELETMEPKAFKWDYGYNIYKFSWVSDTDIIFNVYKWNMYVAGVFRVDREIRKAVTLMGDDVIATLIAPMPDDPLYSWVWVKKGRYFHKENLLVKIPKKGSADRSDFPSFGGRIDSLGIVQETVQPPFGEILGWIIDWAGVPRIVKRYHDKKLQYMHRNLGDTDWETLSIDPEDWRIIDFTTDNSLLFVSGYHGEETIGLYLYDMEKDSVDELIFRDEEYDYTATGRHRFYKDTLVGITYHRERPTSVWFLPQLEFLQGLVDRSIPGRANVISGWSDDLRRLLVASYSDTAPVRYLLFDVENKSLDFIMASAPWLDDTKLAGTSVLHFTTSDGLRLEGYLTIPNGSKAPYPLVCLVHGGPWVRDTGAYNAEAQFLANRGYAVLRLNYRGSSGYGKSVSEDSEYEFRKMHDDITEGVNLLVRPYPKSY